MTPGPGFRYPRCMCGIAGLLLPSPDRVDAKLLRSLSDDLEHRGPDDSGFLVLHDKRVSLHREAGDDVVGNLVLVHRRLSIIELSEAGWQPMGTPDGRYHVVFNGEIYNYLELRGELSALGHRFRSGSDTEVLLAAYAEWGADALNRLVGMFAFALLDVERQRLFMARDFFGIKPLYYARWRDGFVFASEINALLRFPGIARRVHAQRLYDYLRFGVTDHGGDTLFKDIKQLPAAHYIEISLDSARVDGPKRYWHVDLQRRVDLSFDDAARRLRDLFLDSIRLHLRSDVPVGAALSGGIDSSSIVCAMRSLDADLPIHAFSYVADDPALSEERWIDMVGDSAGLIVHKVRSRPAELVSDLESLVSLQGECFASTSIYAQRRVFEEARKHGIKVMLDGQGADEILGGYQPYLAARLASLLRQRRFADAMRFLRNGSRLHGAGGRRLWLRALDFLVPPSLQHPMRRVAGEDLMPSWLNSRWFEERGVRSRSLNYTDGQDVLRHALYDSLTETSLPALLRYEDRNSMASSIESRVPFLTPSLVSFVLALPEEYIITPDGITKSIFRKAMTGLVPGPILQRTDKIGFATPEKQWLLALCPWVERVLARITTMHFPAIEQKEMQREWMQVVSGRKPFNFRVWRWLNTILWVERFTVEID